MGATGNMEKTEKIQYKTSVTLEEAMVDTGFGAFNILHMLLSGLILMGVIMQNLALGYVMPAAQCDLDLSLEQRGWLAAIPFLAIILTSYFWGLLADTKGRRPMMMISMIASTIVSVMASFAPNLISFGILQFLSAIFMAGPAAIVYTYLGEFDSSLHRDKMVAFGASFVGIGTVMLPAMSWLILPLEFAFPIPFLGIDYRPWRLLVVACTIPFFLSSLLLLITTDSVKFLYSSGQHEKCMQVLRNMYSINKRMPRDMYPVQSLLEEPNHNKTTSSKGLKGIFISMKEQTVPLFKSPLLPWTCLVCFVQFGLFATTNGFYIWFPTILNSLANHEGSETKICDVLDAIKDHNGTEIVCDDTINTQTFELSIYIGLVFSSMYIVVGFLVNLVGKKMILVVVLGITGLCGIGAHLAYNQHLAVALFAIFQMSGACIGLMNAVAVELVPTMYRGMAVCLSMLAGRTGSMVGSKAIGLFLQHNCGASFYTFGSIVIGFGKYNLCMLAACCLLILSMYLDIFGFSVMLPIVACDLSLDTTQQALLSAVPLIGVMISSYLWGLCADTQGRRHTLLIAMPLATVANLAASMAPSYASLAALKFLSAGFSSSANAAGFVLLGESVPRRQRHRLIFLMASATMFVQFVIGVFALPIFQLSFKMEISWLSLEYRPWRLLMQVISAPGLVGTALLVFLYESPKSLLSRGKEESAMEVLTSIYRWNSGKNKVYYPVTAVKLNEETLYSDKNTSFHRKIWNQTAPLFRVPLRNNSLKLYFILLCAFMTSTGYTIWVPTITNAYFTGEDTSGKTFCEVASGAAATSITTSTDCDSLVKPMTLYIVICYSGASGCLNILLTFIVPCLGKKGTTLLVFVISAISGILLLFLRIPILSITLFYMFLYVALILGNINTFLVELNPTHLRGMATCLSVVVARGFGFASVQLIGALLENHCVIMVSGYVVLVLAGFGVALFLPPDTKKIEIKRSDTLSTATVEIEKL